MRKQSSETPDRQLEQKKEGYTHQRGRWKINTPVSEHPLGRHSFGSPRIAFSELHPVARGWECFQGGLNIRPDPGLKPWAILCDRFAVNDTWLSITASR
jgi:hypothetical protein